MSCETRQLARIEIVTDHETGMYEMGEVVNCPFDLGALEAYIKSYGEKGIANLQDHLCSMQHALHEMAMSHRRAASDVGCAMDGAS